MLKGIDKLRRTRQIISVLTKYGLDYLIDRHRAGILSVFSHKQIPGDSLSAPEKFCRALEELGPTFIKFGQILSTRPDFLPPPLIKELEKLQDQTPPFDSSSAIGIIERELKKPVSQLFSEFEMKPVAAASLSQVHKATLLNGNIVAVKIQRPGIRQTIETDLAILEDLAGFIENRFHNGWMYRPRMMVEEYKKAIKKELDFSREAHNFEKFRLNFRDVKHVRVPQIYWDMTTQVILTMEFMEGVKINEIILEKNKGIYDPEAVAIRVAEALLKQILEDGFFHADPHPANLFIQPPADVIMLDVGMVGYLDKKTTLEGAKLLQAVVDRDAENALTCFENLKIIVKDVDRYQLRQDLAELFDSYLGLPLKELDINKVGQDIIGIMIRHNLTVPPNLVLMIKALSMIESTGKDLYPDLDILSIAKPFVKKVWRKKFDPQKMLKTGESMLNEGIQLIEQLPEDLNIILHKIREGKLKFIFEFQEAEKLKKSIGKAGHQISLSIIIAALIIGFSLILALQQGDTFFISTPGFGFAGLFIALILSLVLIWSVLKK